jgi:hypothetical protein
VNNARRVKKRVYYGEARTGATNERDLFFSSDFSRFYLKRNVSRVSALFVFHHSAAAGF